MLPFLNLKLFKNYFECAKGKHGLRREERDWSRVLPSDLSLVWFADRTTGRLARVRLPLEKGVGESPSDMASKESADASDRCSVWSPKLGCGLCDGFGLLVCKTEHCVIGQLDLEYLGKITRTTKQKTKRRRKNSKLLQILVCWRSLLCRLFKKTVSVGILLRFLLLYIHVANFIANKALRTRSAEETYGNAIPCCSNNYYSIDMSTHTHTCAYWTCKIRKVFIVLS